MNRIVVFFSIFLGMLSMQVQAQLIPTLSEDAEISIMTLGPFQGELYSAFGHSAIHVYDSGNRLNVVFNYGVFDFDQENFFWNFARGKMLYQLGLSSYNRFKRNYERENRYIIEQHLNLTQIEKQKLYDFLLTNYLPQNREYYYNYVYDNCASRIRDVLKLSFRDRVAFDSSYVQKDKTVRDLMHDYLMWQPWGEWIIDIGLGAQIDQEASASVYMFLPDYIDSAFAKATLKRDSLTVPLVSERELVYEPTPEEHSNGMFTPFNVFVVFFFIVGFITNRDFKKDRRTKWLDPIVFTLPGILGWWMVFLWFGTVHLSKYNYDLLWAIPLHIPFVYLLGFKKLQPFLTRYFFWVSILYLVLIVVWGFLPEPLNDAIIPLVLAMVLRGFYIYFDLRKLQGKTSSANE